MMATAVTTTESPASPAPESLTGAATVSSRTRAVLAGRRVPRITLERVLFAVPVVVLAVGAWVHRFVNEDGFINFHVVQQLSAGNGPVFNPGERVEAYTSPMFIAVLAAGRLLAGWAISLPKFAVAIGLVFTVTALILGMAASRRLALLVRPAADTEPIEGDAAGGRLGSLLVPVGALLIACTPPMWRWATSGLETSLSFVWIALCFWALVRRYDRSRDASLTPIDRPRWLLVVIGLGMLVRPELLVYSVVFLAALWLTSTRDRRSVLLGALWAAAVPVGYQIFRMGYFAAIVPNTALAKGADASHWDWGVQYAKQFLGVQWMWLALAAVAVLLTVAALRVRRADGRALWLLLAPVGGAALHVLYIQKVGGDYMYARFYIPAFFALVLPVMVVAVPKRIAWSAPVVATFGAGLVLVLWSLVALVNGKILDANTGLDFGDYGMLLPGATNPVEPEDYGIMYASMQDVFSIAAANPDVLIDTTDANHKPIPLQPGHGTVVISGAIGVTSYVGGADVWIIDNRGLADSIGARLYPNQPYLFAGHERLLSYEWSVARWTPPLTTDSPKTTLIRKVLTCPDFVDLDDATTGPMSVGRFLSNIALSRRLSSMRVFDDPVDSEKWLCAQQ